MTGWIRYSVENGLLPDELAYTEWAQWARQIELRRKDLLGS
jgi:hypothetical protein